MNQNNKYPQPPRWVDYLLEWCFAPHLLEEVQGDLHERFYKRVQQVGEEKARREYTLQALKFMRPFAFNRKTNTGLNINYPDMLLHFFKTSLRHFLRQKGYSFLNLAGLSLGLATSLLILLWVRDEMSYNQFHKHSDRLYFVWHLVNLTNGQIRTVSDTQGPLGPALKEELPEVEDAFRMADQQRLFKVGDKVFNESGIVADPSLFHMFTVPLLAGNPKTLLADVSSIVISQTLAEKYFGSAKEAMAKVIRVDNAENYTVSGVFKDMPQNSSVKFDFVIPFEVIWKNNRGLQDWGNSSILTFVLLKENAAASVVNRKIENFVKKYAEKSISTLMLQPYKDLYLYDKFENGKQAGGRIVYVRLFSVIAAFILLIACINFMNLATARSAQRAKEVGVRKVVGANSFSLIGQFLAESLLLAALSMCMALILIAIVLPYFNRLTDKHIAIPFSDLSFIAALMGITLITGLLAGSYPAFFLSSFKSIQVLKGRLRIGPGSAYLRQGLVVFQFLLSMSLIVATVVIYQQIHYMKNKDLGLDRENIINFGGAPSILKHYEAYRTSLLAQPGISSIGLTSQNLTGGDNTTTSLEWDGKAPNEMISFQIIHSDYDFVKTLGIHIKEGRAFSRDFAADSLNYIINEEAAKRMGLQPPVVGQRLNLWGREGRIIGLAEDFHINKLHVKIMPVVMTLRPENAWMIYVRTKPGQTSEAIASLKKMHDQFVPEFPFSYNFLDESFERMYRSDVTVGKLATSFAFITIFISCLGLFGLAAFTAEKRTKEIGIRKVLGASVSSIVHLLSKDFIKLVLLACLIAWPLAWWAMHRWLEGFEYRTPIQWWVFVVAGLAALLIALLTVSFQSIKAALANPVKSLRSE